MSSEDFYAAEINPDLLGMAVAITVPDETTRLVFGNSREMIQAWIEGVITIPDFDAWWGMLTLHKTVQITNADTREKYRFDFFQNVNHAEKITTMSEMRAIRERNGEE